MTKDREFKQQVRDRAAKTGQSYQSTHRAMSGSQAAQPESSGEAEVREIFYPHGGRQAAGCLIRSGEVHVGDKAQVVRDGAVIAEGDVTSLRTYLKPVSRVSAGQECGIQLADFEDHQVGDVLLIEATGRAQAAKERLFDAVLDATCEATGQEREALLGSSRTLLAVLARNQAMYVLDYVGLERAAIADGFGRPIGTVHQAIEKVAVERGQRPDREDRLSAIFQRFNARLAEIGSE